MTKKKMYEVFEADGNTMGAAAAVHADTDVVAAYPITPCTQVAERIGDHIKRKELDAECLRMDGEDSAGAACTAASIAGSRTLDITSSQGLLFKAQNLYFWAGARCPVVLLVATRAVNAPCNIHDDFSDVMSLRDAGQIMFFAKNPQEVYDFTLLGFKIAEDPRVQLPFEVCYRGFKVSHTMTINKILSPDGVKVFRPWLGTYKRPQSVLDFEHPIVAGGLVMPDYYIETKYGQNHGMRQVPAVIKEATNYFSKRFWPVFSDTEEFMVDDAEYVAVVLGDEFGMMKDAVRQLRARGIKAGAIRVVCYRPFPVKKIQKLLAGKLAVAVFDQAISSGGPSAPLCSDLRSALYNSDSKTPVRGFVYGLGGRTLELTEVVQSYESLKHPKKWIRETEPCWIGVRGGSDKI
jgi:pyruvate ferredoxin oxidoreductase alpha subunit